MNIQKALDFINWWEGENTHVNPTQGSEDEMNVPDCMTVVGPVVVRSYYTQGQILSEIWRTKDVLVAVQSVNGEALNGEKPEFEIWQQVKFQMQSVVI